MSSSRGLFAAPSTKISTGPAVFSKLTLERKSVIILPGITRRKNSCSEGEPFCPSCVILENFYMQTSEELIKAHAKELFGYLCRYAGDPALAEDLLGEVFVRFLMQYKVKTDPNFQWRPWLYRVATNLVISHLRRQKLW